MGSSTGTLEVTKTERLRSTLGQYFYLFMSLLIAAIVISAFSRTIDRRLIHAVPVRPWVLYLHGIVFFGWVIFFIIQAALVRVHKVKVHRMLGWFGVTLGVVIPVLGMWTSIAMDRFEIFHLHIRQFSPFLALQIHDLAAFAIFLALAIVWRKKPEFHRRTILLASCMLTGAAFARLPFSGLMRNYHYMDMLILLGVLRDLIVNRRVHPVYGYAFPALIVGQTTAMHLFLSAPSWWVSITDAILRVS